MATGGELDLDVHALPVAALVLREGLVVAANDACRDELGVDPWELHGRPLAELLVGDDGERADETFARCERERSTEVVEVRFAVGEGERLIELSCRGSAGGVLAVVRDCTERRQLRAMVEVLADSTLLVDGRGLVAWQSDGLTSRLGGGRAGIGVNPMERIHPEDLPRVLDSYNRAVTSSGVFDRYTVRSRAPDDDERWQLIEVSGVSALDHPDLAGVVVQVRNLPEGELTGALGRTDGQYQSLTDAAPIGIVVDDRHQHTIYRNPTAQDLLGQGPELHQGVPWRQMAQPEYRVVLDKMVSSALERQSVGNAIAAFGDGPDARWLRVKVAPQVAERADGDAVVGVITTLEDVTAEVEARAEAERLTQMLDATSDYVAVFRPTGEELYLNHSVRVALDRLGELERPAQLVDLIDADVRRLRGREFLKSLMETNIWRGELLLNAAPERQVPVSVLAVARRGPGGEIEWIAMLARDISEVKEAESRLRQLATRDTLTGLANRSLGNDRLEQAVARHRRRANGVAVLFCDLDGFKAINDAYGHAAGDRVLIEIARRLLAGTRAADTVARVGGDEFVVVCEGLVVRERLASLAERIIDAVSAPVGLPNGELVQVGISIGVAVADGPVADTTFDADRLLTQADTAMYRAKAHGGSGYRIVNV